MSNKKSMTVKYIEKQVQFIASIAGDDEAAHGMEDSLYAEVFQAIAEGRCSAPADCARAVLETKKLDFARWCA